MFITAETPNLSGSLPNPLQASHPKKFAKLMVLLLFNRDNACLCTCTNKANMTLHGIIFSVTSHFLFHLWSRFAGHARSTSRVHVSGVYLKCSGTQTFAALYLVLLRLFSPSTHLSQRTNHQSGHLALVSADEKACLFHQGAGVPWNIRIGKYRNNSHFSQGNIGTAIQQKEENVYHNI